MRLDRTGKCNQSELGQRSVQGVPQRGVSVDVPVLSDGPRSGAGRGRTGRPRGRPRRDRGSLRGGGIDNDGVCPSDGAGVGFGSKEGAGVGSTQHASLQRSNPVTAIPQESAKKEVDTGKTSYSAAVINDQSPKNRSLSVVALGSGKIMLRSNTRSGAGGKSIW